MSLILPSRINVLFMIIQPKIGGAERLVYNLIRGIDRSLFNPSLAYFNEGCDINEFKNLDIKIHHVQKTKRFDFSTMKKIGYIIRNEKINIVNSHHFMPMIYSFYGAKISNQIKLIYTEHSRWELETIKYHWEIAGRTLLKFVDLSVGVSENVTNAISEKFKVHLTKTQSVYNGVASSKSTANNRESLKKQLNIENGYKVIGIVANFRKIKNHIFLLKAFNEVLREYKHVKLLLVGQGFEGDKMNSENQIREFITEQNLTNSVIFLGFRSDVMDLLNTFDIFCLTSIKEGLPISLIEAMMTGLPVVGTNVDGINEVIVHKKNGFLVELDDVNELKDRLLQLLREEGRCQEFGVESERLAIERYSLENCINQYQKIFKSLM